MEASSLVIKVKYGDILRRFGSRVSGDELDVDIDGLKEKILSLFNLAPNTALTLTYTDEEGDEVTFVDDDDLRDMVTQGLDPLRITVKLSAEKNGGKCQSSKSSSPLNSIRVQKPFQYHKTALQPLCEKLVNLSTDLASKVSSTPHIADLIDYFSGVSSSYLDISTQSQPSMGSPTHINVPENTVNATETKVLNTSKADAAPSITPSNVGSQKFIKHSEGLEKPEPLMTILNNAVKHVDTSVQGMTAISATAPGFDAVMFGSQTVDVGQPVSESSQNSSFTPESRVVPSSVDKSEKFNKTINCYSNYQCSPRVSHLPPVSNKCWVAGMCDVSCNGHTEKAIYPELELDIVSPDSMEQNHLYRNSKFVTTGDLPNSSCSIWAPCTCSLEFPSSSPGPNPEKNVSVSPSYPSYSSGTFSWSSSQNDVYDICHQEVFCDGCGAEPILGPRFKSKVLEDYDLCTSCFLEKGNGRDYICIEPPHDDENQVLCDSHAWGRDPAFPEGCMVSEIKSSLFDLDSCLIQDVNIFDDTVMEPLTPFTKIWQMRNSGVVAWPKKTQLVWTGGDILSNLLSVNLKIPPSGLDVGQDLHVAVDFVAPESPGRYMSHWRMASPSGELFGQHIWVHIQVKDHVNRKPCDRLNLNFPPLNPSDSDSKMSHLVPIPQMKVSFSTPEPANSKKMAEPFESVIHLQPKSEQAIKLPVNYSLTTGSVASGAGQSTAATMSYPVPGHSNEAVILSPLPIDPQLFRDPAKSAYQFHEHKEDEKKLLRELEAGFKHVDWRHGMWTMNEDLNHKEYDSDDQRDQAGRGSFVGTSG